MVQECVIWSCIFPIHIVYCFFYFIYILLSLCFIFLLINIKCIHKRVRHTMRWKVYNYMYVCNLCAQFRKCKSTFTFHEKFIKIINILFAVALLLLYSFVVIFIFFCVKHLGIHSGMRYSFKELWRLRKIDVLTVWKCCSLSNL